MGVPQTVVFNKDGSVKQVWIGFGSDTEQQLRQEVDASKAEPKPQ